MLMPPANGLFRRAISQSGCVRTMGFTTDPGREKKKVVSLAKKLGESVVRGKHGYNVVAELNIQSLHGCQLQNADTISIWQNKEDKEIGHFPLSTQRATLDCVIGLLLYTSHTNVMYIPPFHRNDQME